MAELAGSVIPVTVTTAQELDAVIDGTPPLRVPRIDGVVLLQVTGVEAASVMLDAGTLGLGAAVSAPTIATVTAADVGRVAAVTFVGGDVRRPLVLGLLHLAEADGRDREPAPAPRLVLEATDSLELRCGSARIVLTQDGRVVIRGDHVSSRAAGVNTLSGAAVQIN
ncbi:MAG: DUF6484 domain-containing protein [Gemmatimonadaceae bacterium]|jgi:hypothetical protein|nr:DUF6484 domain-containing protein [Gemmatimonadaceae bacterium]